MSVYKVVASLAYQSGLPEDVAINDFYFVKENPDDTEADIDSLVARLDSFYNDIPAGGTKSLSDYVGIQVSRVAEACSFLVYRSPTIIPVTLPWGSPVGVRSWTLGAGDSASGYPAEVAAALSYHADLTNVPETQTNPDPPPAIIRPASRKRGRLYFGPLIPGAGSNEGPNQDASMTTAVRTHFARSMEDLLAANDELDWCVFSPTGLTVSAVVGGYVDDAFDTQRRRGTAADVRTSWPL